MSITEHLPQEHINGIYLLMAAGHEQQASALIACLHPEEKVPSKYVMSRVAKVAILRATPGWRAAYDVPAAIVDARRQHIKEIFKSERIKIPQWVKTSYAYTKPWYDHRAHDWRWIQNRLNPLIWVGAEIDLSTWFRPLRSYHTPRLNEPVHAEWQAHSWLKNRTEGGSDARI